VLSFNIKNLRTSHQTIWFVLDALMLLLLVINLLWLTFDSLYATALVSDFLTQQMPSFADAYNPIHKNFLFYDLIFVSIFLSEFTVRWVHAVYAHTYRRWYFYPFIHWYDLLGCVPASGPVSCVFSGSSVLSTGCRNTASLTLPIPVCSSSCSSTTTPLWKSCRTAWSSRS